MVYPHGRAKVSATSPRAHAVCDRCNFTYNLRDLSWQFEYAGVKLQNLRILVCESCLDKPQPQLRTIILPPDPVPVMNPRPEAYSVEVPNFLSTITGNNFITMGSSGNLITMIMVTPVPYGTGVSS